MTSFAFILGCVPLAIATGSGASGRQILGTVVVTGMMAATALAISLFHCCSCCSSDSQTKLRGVTAEQPGPATERWHRMKRNHFPRVIGALLDDGAGWMHG